MNEFLINMAITTLLTLLKGFLTGGENRNKWKKAVLKIFKQIVIVFGDDAEFQEAFKNKGK